MNGFLWLALRLPDLPLQSFPAYPEEQAVCVLEKQHVIAANAAAFNAGVRIGMDATTAHLLSDCLTYPRDIAKEQENLDQLAERLYAFTPYVHIYRSAAVPDSGVILEISRCLRLFGGVLSLCEKVFASLEDISYSYGLAHTKEGAWLLSYEKFPIDANDDAAIFINRLKSLPLERLFDWPEAVVALKRSGFISLGDIARQISAQSIGSIQKRLGADFTEFLQRVFSIESNFQQSALFKKPVEVYQPKEFFFDSMEFDYPIAQVELLYIPIETMLQKLAEFLRKRKLACQHIEWRFFDIHQRSHQLKVYCAQPQITWKLLYELTLIQLQSQQLPFEVDAIELTCQNLQPWREQNRELDFSGKRRKSRSSDDLALLDAKLKARLGEQAVYKISYKDSHVPELSYQAISVFAKPEQTLPMQQKTSPRPTWLFKTPLPVKQQHNALFWRGKLELSMGPERMEGQWWVQHTARDYYIAIRDDGLRVWIYRDLFAGDWFVQGVFAY